MMAMIEDDPLEVTPDADLVPTMSTLARDFKAVRDMVRCFPLGERHAIPIETPDGLESATQALGLLRIRRELKELEFPTLWRSYCVAVKLSGSYDGTKTEEQNIADAKTEKLNIVRAYNYILRHLKQMKQVECEEARVARDTAYKARMSDFTVRGEAPGDEDPLDPVVPIMPVVLRGKHGVELSIATLVYTAKMMHIRSVELALLGTFDPDTGVDGSEMLSDEDSAALKANRLRVREIYELIAGANSPAGKFIELLQDHYFIDFRSRCPEITSDMGWITRVFMQRVTNVVDAKRVYAADFDQSRATCPKMTLVEKIAWLAHFDKAAGMNSEVGTAWLVEMALAHGPLGKQLGIKPVLTDEQHRTLSRLVLESDVAN